MFTCDTLQKSVSLEELIDLLSESNPLLKPFFKGGCTTHRVQHPEHGQLILIETPDSNECLVFKV